MQLILASTSIYRKQMLERLGLPFDCIDPQFDEAPLQEQLSDPIELTKRLACAKARAVYHEIKTDHPNATIIGGDQVSLYDGKILGKPLSFERACEQLQMLQSNTHELHTSCCLKRGESEIIIHDVTTLKMRPLSMPEIKRYIEQDDPLQCAGTYKIESLGISLFEQVQTNDFSAIVGLPLMTLSQRLRGLGFSIP